MYAGQQSILTLDSVEDEILVLTVSCGTFLTSEYQNILQHRGSVILLSTYHHPVKMILKEELEV